MVFYALIWFDMDLLWFLYIYILYIICFNMIQGCFRFEMFQDDLVLFQISSALNDSMTRAGGSRRHLVLGIACGDVPSRFHQVSIERERQKMDIILAGWCVPSFTLT